MEQIKVVTSWIPSSPDFVGSSIPLSLLCLCAVIFFLYYSKAKTKKELAVKDERIKSLEDKVKSLTELLKNKDHKISQLIYTHDSFDPLETSEDSEGLYVPPSVYFPKQNKLKRGDTPSIDCPTEISKDCEHSTYQKMNVTFTSLRKSEGDTIFLYEEEKPALSSFELTNLKEFKRLLEESENWQVVKKFEKSKCSLEVRISDVITNGTPYCKMSCIFEGIKPKEVFRLFSEDILDQESWNPHCNSVDEFIPEQGVRILRTRVKLPLVSNREFIDRTAAFYYPEDDKSLHKECDNSNGTKPKYYSFCQCVSPQEFNYEHVFPQSKDYVRGVVYFNGYSFEECENGNSTLLTQIIQSDVKGSIPKFIINRVTPSGMYDLVVNLDKALRGHE
ncbi:unnamed protein product [Moneuplotes crassus]|uniref:START domain-containing protein n=1 Tax=Euplotes crassus TaxID=5936 RepID=A0AAD1XH55_EUPCR|nr:unnamed protein product [Moneuplotes crassus]